MWPVVTTLAPPASGGDNAQVVIQAHEVFVNWAMFEILVPIISAVLGVWILLELAFWLVAVVWRHAFPSAAARTASVMQSNYDRMMDDIY